MNESYMKYVASIFDLELDEPFMLTNVNGDIDKCSYMLTRYGLEQAVNQANGIYERTEVCDTLLCNMLRGYYDIKKIPWKPHFGEIYYIPSLEDGEAYVSRLCWADNYVDEQRYASKMVYRSEDEAIAKAEKMLAVLEGSD